QTRCRQSFGKGGSESKRDRVSKPALRFFVRHGAGRQSSRGQTGDFMVKVAVLLSLVLLCAAPLLAQDDYPKIQTSLGYANLNLIDLGKFNAIKGQRTGESAHHSGFANA